MKVGIGASSDVQVTVDRCRKLGVECVYMGSLPGYEENGYPDANRLRQHGIEGEIGRQWSRGVERYLSFCAVAFTPLADGALNESRHLVDP